MIHLYPVIRILVPRPFQPATENFEYEAAGSDEANAAIAVFRHPATCAASSSPRGTATGHAKR